MSVPLSSLFSRPAYSGVCPLSSLSLIHLQTGPCDPQLTAPDDWGDTRHCHCSLFACCHPLKTDCDCRDQGISSLSPFKVHTRPAPHSGNVMSRSSQGIRHVRGPGILLTDLCRSETLFVAL